jgi:hypothetical protein
MNTGSNIRYVRFMTPQGIGYACFAILWERESEKFIHYKIGSSFCSPKDSFNKTIAKTIAKGRLSRNNIIGVVPSIPASRQGFILDAEFDAMLHDLMKSKELIPSWAYKSFSRDKYVFTLSSNRIK